jgi:PAS domain-containing protein
VTAGVEMMVPIHHWPAPALIIRSWGRIVAANAAMADCLGTKPAALVGKALGGLAVDDAKLAEFLSNGSEASCEIRFRGIDGGVRLLALFIARRAVPEGDILSAVDMTLCRAAERKLREERDRYFDMLRAGSDWFFESETTSQTESETAARICLIRSGPDGALTSYELHTKWPDALVDRSYDPEGLAAHMKRMSARQPFRDMTYRRVDAEGKERYFRASGVPYMRNGSPIGYRGASADVTAQVRAEQAWRRDRHLLEMAQRLAGYGSAARDLATGSECWSPELRRLLGVAAGSPAPEAALASFVHEADRAGFRSAMAKVEAGESMPRSIIRVVEPGGATRRLEVAMELLRDPAGTPETLLMVFKQAA